MIKCLLCKRQLFTGKKKSTVFSFLRKKLYFSRKKKTRGKNWKVFYLCLFIPFWSPFFLPIVLMLNCFSRKTTKFCSSFLLFLQKNFVFSFFFFAKTTGRCAKMLYVSMQMSINKRKPFKGYNGNKTKWRKKKQTSLLLKIKVLKKKRHEKFLKSCFVCFFLFYSFFFRWLKVVESSKEMIVQLVVNYLSFLFPSICEELKKWGWNEESCWK